MPSGGGVPVRLTYTATLNRDDISDRMGPNNIVMTWRDNNSIVYRSRKQSFNDFKGQLFVVNVNGGLSEELPLPAGGFCSYSPDKSKLAYNRVFREFRTWKYYKGGMADDIWIYDFKSKATENITNNKFQDIFPMWYGDKIYFASDRDRTMNLFCYDLKTQETKKVTDFTEFDVKFPSLGDDAIAFENGGFIYLFDLVSQKIKKVTVLIADDQITGRNQLKDASKFINTFSVSPDGKRIAFGARGDIWTVPAKSGITRNLTENPTYHDRDVAWSPDGQYIAFISDRTGEDEIYIMKQDCSAAPVQITKNADTYKYAVTWSPDSKKLLWADKKLRLQFVDIDSKDVTLIDRATSWEFTDYNWSPDNKWIAYSFPERRITTRLFMYDVLANKKFPVTDTWYDAANPTFSSDGKYLFFTSNRDFNPTYSWTEWNHSYSDMTKVYFLVLAKDTPNPFAYENDEVSVKNEGTKDEGRGTKEEGKGTKDEKAKDEKKEVVVKVDEDGIIDRIVALPIDASSYWNVNAIGTSVYYVKGGGGRRGPASLMMYDLKDRKESNLGEFGTYEISADNKKMLVSSQDRKSVV